MNRYLKILFTFIIIQAVIAGTVRAEEKSALRNVELL